MCSPANFTCKKISYKWSMSASWGDTSSSIRKENKTSNRQSPSFHDCQPVLISTSTTSFTPQCIGKFLPAQTNTPPTSIPKTQSLWFFSSRYTHTNKSVLPQKNAHRSCYKLQHSYAARSFFWVATRRRTRTTKICAFSFCQCKTFLQASTQPQSCPQKTFSTCFIIS